MLLVNCQLNVVPNPNFHHIRHSPAIWIRQRYLIPTCAVQLGKQTAELLPPRNERRNLLLSVTASTVRTDITGRFHIVGKFFVGATYKIQQLCAREVPMPIIDRLHARTIHGKHFPAEQIEPTTDDGKLAENLLESCAIHSAKRCDCPIIRFQLAQQPDHLDITAGFCFQLSARTYPVQISVEVKFKQISRIVAGAARLFCRYAGKPSGDKINAIHKTMRRTGLSDPT